MCERPNNHVIGDVINATRRQITPIFVKYVFEQRVLVITWTNQIIFIFLFFNYLSLISHQNKMFKHLFDEITIFFCRSSFTTFSNQIRNIHVFIDHESCNIIKNDVVCVSVATKNDFVVQQNNAWSTAPIHEISGWFAFGFFNVWIFHVVFAFYKIKLFDRWRNFYSKNVRNFNCRFNQFGIFKFRHCLWCCFL